MSKPFQDRELNASTEVARRQTGQRLAAFLKKLPVNPAAEVLKEGDINRLVRDLRDRGSQHEP